MTNHPIHFWARLVGEGEFLCWTPNMTPYFNAGYNDSIGGGFGDGANYGNGGGTGCGCGYSLVDSRWDGYGNGNHQNWDSPDGESK